MRREVYGKVFREVIPGVEVGVAGRSCMIGLERKR